MKQKRIKIGVVAVDSGQLMICDPCYIDSEWSKEEIKLNKQGNFKPAKMPFSYATVTSKTLSNPTHGQLYFKMGHAGVAVAFPSGYGDGIYPVYGTFNKDGRCVKVEIDCNLTMEQKLSFKKIRTKQFNKPYKQ